MTVELLTVADVAHHVGLTERTIRAAIRDGELVGCKLRGQLRVHPADLAAWIDDNRTTKPIRLERHRPSSAPRAAAPNGGFRQAARDLSSAA